MEDVAAHLEISSDIFVLAKVLSEVRTNDHNGFSFVHLYTANHEPVRCSKNLIVILVALIVLPVNPLEQFQHIKMKDDIAYVTNSASDSKTLLKFVQLLYLSMRWNSKALVGILEKVCP